MERFLSQCAEYIYNKHQHQLHNLCIVFPNRRSGIFFKSYLQKIVRNTAIGPHITTVDELLTGYSTLHQGEKLQLISALYRIYRKHIPTQETFDDFYFWGEVLLSDFNDIDRYLVSAKDLFTNVADLKEIGNGLDYLSPEQKEAIERFWGSIPPENLKINHERFLDIWKNLFNVYIAYKEYLLEREMGYGGMIYRHVIEQFKKEPPTFEFENYYIIGLNALNTCEKTFFRMLGRKAVFLWDYDEYYLDAKNEAGKFIRENLKQFPAPADFVINISSFTQNKNIELVAVSSAYGQAQAIPPFLEKIADAYKNEFDNTAIVLADESLLYPALGAIPLHITPVNITMGYPVKNSVVYGFLLLLINLLKNRRKDREGRVVVYHRYVTDILNHQLLGNVENEKVKKYISDLKKFNVVAVPVEDITFSEIHRHIFSLPGKVEDYNTYFLKILEMLFSIIRETDADNKLLPELINTLYQSVEKIGNAIVSVQAEQENFISDTIYYRLFSQYTGQASVSFEGEPLVGMQVMGILETRCLDFDNIIILGLNESKWPRTYVAPSFIPFNIRKGFGLPAIDEQDAMYAYYFYRLLQRAQHVTATYSVVKEGMGNGELSRYGYQLLYESGFKVKQKSLDFRFSNQPAPPVIIPGSKQKSAKILLGNSADRPLSPTAVSTWLQCRAKFYFRYILQLPEPEEMKDEIDSMAFGNIFHDAIEQLYLPFRGKTISRSELEGIIKDTRLIEEKITTAIGKFYAKKVAPGKPVPIEGKARLIFENIKIFIRRLIETDMELAPFQLIGLEEKVNTLVEVMVDQQPVNVYIGGKIDRIDKVNGAIRILDYKTGNVDNLSVGEVGDLFEKDRENNKKEILQALIYSMVFHESRNPGLEIQPGIYSLRKLFADNFSPGIKRNNQKLVYSDVREEFRSHLTTLVGEILSSESSFLQTPHLKNCTYCAYMKICQRY